MQPLIRVTKSLIPALCAFALLLPIGLRCAAQSTAFPVNIRVDAGAPGSELKPIWRFFGADEPNYATMKNGSKLMAELGELRPKSVYFRAPFG
jgi:xylan 1,4-beta-xylosidase